MAEVTPTEYLDITGLQYYDGKLKTFVDKTYVKKEFKTGSDSAYKVLSDNNLTDELLQKLMNAGDSTFSGNYNDLLNIPTLDGTDIKGTLTTEGLGIAKKTDLPGVATAETTGLVKVDDVTIKVDATGKIAAQLGDYIKSSEVDTKLEEYAKTEEVDEKLEEYAKTTEMESTIESAKEELEGKIDSDVAGAKSELEGKIDSAKSELESMVDSKVASTYKPAGSVTLLSAIPAPSAAVVGNVYNVESSFVTTENFVEGAGKDYPAGTNVVIVEPSTGVYKYDALAGFVDLSGYLQTSSIAAIPNAKIDTLFA